MKVVLSPDARQEILAIGAYVSQDDPAAAVRLTNSLFDRCFALANAPERGGAVGISRGVRIRQLVHDSYRILYSVSGAGVRVHRVIHGARNPKLLLKNIDPHA